MLKIFFKCDNIAFEVITMNDFSERTISEQIKFRTKEKGYTIKTLGDEFNKRYGTNYMPQSFSRKINNPALALDDLKKIGQILGFKVKLEAISEV